MTSEPGGEIEGWGFDDPRWTGLVGGYRIPYDPRPTLRALERGGDAEAAWRELSTELYDQGDVGEASYAAIPHVVRICEKRDGAVWDAYALAAMIELARRDGGNPEVPAELSHAYQAAWRRLVAIGLRQLEVTEDPLLVSYIVAVVAIAKGQTSLGRFAALFDESERIVLLHDAGWA